jgi:hypothetical protein
MLEEHDNPIKWLDLIRSLTNSDAWSFVLLDYYHKSGKSQPPGEFVREVIDQVLPDNIGLASTHRVLVCTMVQLLGSDFDGIFSASLDFLLHRPNTISDTSIDELAEPYVPYGRREEFIAVLKSRLPGSVPLGVDVEVHSKAYLMQPAHNIEQLQDLDEVIRSALVRLGDEPSKRLQPPGYIQAFREDGERKAKAFIEEVRKAKIVEDNAAVVSIGGADGSELGYILEHTRISRGVLLEESTIGTGIAIELARSLEAKGKTLKVLPGDATKKIKESTALLSEWRRSGLVRGVCYTINSVFHELPDRASNFDPRKFLAEVVGDWHPFFLLLREPVEPVGWPAEVELVSPHTSGDRLAQFAEEIARRLKVAGKVATYTGNSVLLPRKLAVELLFKFFNIHSLEYELEESVTSFTADEIEGWLKLLVGDRGMVKRSDLNSDTFDRKCREYNIGFRTKNGEPLVSPRVFVQFVVTKP